MRAIIMLVEAVAATVESVSDSTYANPHPERLGLRRMSPQRYEDRIYDRTLKPGDRRPAVFAMRLPTFEICREVDGIRN